MGGVWVGGREEMGERWLKTLRNCLEVARR